jgi:dTDP-4-amino-4,6-dideoxygalactose transaminase
VKYYHDFLGKNARLDTIQAAVLNVKIKYLNDWNKKRNYVANKYFELLKDIPGIKLPKIKENNYSVFHLFVIKTDFRDELMDYLNNFKIPTVIHYPIPIHLQKAYTNLGFKKGDFPITEKIADQIISIPIHPNLFDTEIEYITSKIKDFFKGKLNN